MSAAAFSDDRVNPLAENDLDQQFARALLQQPDAQPRAARGQRGYVRLEGRTWVLHYRAARDETGKRPKLRLVLGSIEELPDYPSARAAGDRAAMRMLPPRLAPGASPKWHEWCDRYLSVHASKLGPDTIATHTCIVNRHLRKPFAGLHLHELDILRVQRFIDASNAAGVKPSTTRTRFNVLHKMMRCAAKENLAVNVPRTSLIDFAVEVRVVKTAAERALTELQVERLLTAARGALRLQIQLGLCIGLRSGEIFGLTWANIELDADPARLHVRQQAPRREVRKTKTEASVAAIELPSVLLAELQVYRDAWVPNPEGFLFAGRDGRPLCSSGARSRHLRPVMQQLGLSGSFHALRHTFGVRLGLSGAGLATIKDAMRLSSLKAAEVYVRARREDTVRAVHRASLIASSRQTAEQAGR